jgi:transcriptional regulator
MPPTVYYTAVHCYGTLSFQREAELRGALEDLTLRNEAKIRDGWHTNEIAEKDIARRLSAILGFEFHIDRLEAKFKLGQDEPKRDALAVAERLLASENPNHRILGAMTRRYNVNRT